MKKKSQQEMLVLTLLYRLIEHKEKIPLVLDGTPYEFVDDILTLMQTKELIQVGKDKEHYEVSAKGNLLKAKLVEIYDEMLKFEMFGNVNLGLELPEEICADGELVYNDCYDPRFAIPDSEAEAETWGSEDMRLAVFHFMAHQCGKPLNAERAVFLNQLADGAFEGENIWFELKLGTPLSQIQDILKSAYKWQELSEDESEALAIAQTIYSAGLIETYKQDNRECEACQIPLAMFDLEAKDKGETLTRCPSEDCGAPLPKDSSNVDGFLDFFDPKSRSGLLTLLAEPLF